MKQQLNQKTRRLFLLGRNSGQASVEYILIAALSVAIVVSMRGAFQNARELTYNYMGAYITCLMEYGELPTLGVEEADLKTHKSEGSQCNVNFRGFTLAEGRPSLGGGGGSGGSGSSSNPSNKNQNANQNQNAADKNNSSNSSGSSSSSGGSDTAGGGRSSVGSARNPIRSGGSSRNTVDGIASSGSGNKVTELEEDNADGGGGGRGLGSRDPGRQTRTIYRSRNKYTAIIGEEAEKLEAQTNRPTKREPASKIIAKTEEGGLSGPKTSAYKPPEIKPPTADESQNQGWSFGVFLKWLLIIAMIIAILIFFGGQILNYSNSDS